MKVYIYIYIYIYVYIYIYTHLIQALYTLNSPPVVSFNLGFGVYGLFFFGGIRGLRFRAQRNI